MADPKVEYSRLRQKRSALAGVEPTIATSSILPSDDWLTTDIMVGEEFLNTVDDRYWVRTENGIMEINTSSTYSTSSIWVDNGTDISLGATHSGKPVLGATDDTSDLGSSSLRWKDLYLGSKIDFATSLTFSQAGSSIALIDSTGLQMQNGKVIKTANGGGQIQLDVIADLILISTDNGMGTESYLQLSPTTTNLSGGANSFINMDTTVSIEAPVSVNINSNLASVSGGSGYASIISSQNSCQIVGGGSNVIIGSGTSSITNGGAYLGIYSSNDSTIVGTGTDFAAIIGGQSNDMLSNNDYSVIAGGRFNVMQSAARYGFIGGGNDNVIGSNADFSAIVGGDGNDVSGDYTFIIGGLGNSITSSESSFMLGGGDNTIAGGIANAVINTFSSAIGTGNFNNIFGGVINNINGTSSLCSSFGGFGGNDFTTSDQCSALSSGGTDFIDSLRSVAVGGNNMNFNNTISCGSLMGQSTTITDSTNCVTIIGDSSTINNCTNTVIIGEQINADESNMLYVNDFTIGKWAAVPANSADSVGATGSVTWDANFIYVKTGTGAWKRSAMLTF